MVCTVLPIMESVKGAHDGVPPQDRTESEPVSDTGAKPGRPSFCETTYGDKSKLTPS